MDLCDIYNCGRSTMYYVVWDVVGSINNCASLALKFPTTQAVLETLHAKRFFNGHKMGYGLNLQAACAFCWRVLQLPRRN